MPYACAYVSDCLTSMIFTCTNLLGALLGAAGSNIGIRHGEMEVVVVDRGSTRERDGDVRGVLMC